MSAAATSYGPVTGSAPNRTLNSGRLRPLLRAAVTLGAGLLVAGLVRIEAIHAASSLVPLG